MNTSIKRYPAKEHHQPVERICRTLELRDDPQLIAEVPVGFDWDAAMERLASLPRQQEWEDYMAIFQLVKPGSTAAEKWQPMERIFHLYD